MSLNKNYLFNFDIYNYCIGIMCHNIKITNRTKNGIVVACVDCKKYQVLFKNLNFNFSQYEYESFINYLRSIDAKGWEEEYKNSIYEKKIPIPTAQQNLIILIDSAELTEIKDLLLHSDYLVPLGCNDIDYRLFNN
ncbi:DUF6686 family protein [Abyssalbus ytuae]|uniref:Uncharacterized protein n=1 Tax=Abyssalbus ytuae TaxID=2926907 RepID=A0A9E6ZZF7_9FLAO|nr:DUF6686 family protein [Abyssalbus ytuae]UOB17992.1 hypothetical protein MQE35_01530 [Abyssalbus ytuae]